MLKIRRKTITSLSHKNYRKITTFIKSRPFASFFIALGILLLFIIIGNILTMPKTQPSTASMPKQVTIYNIGETPKVTFQTKIEKTGVTKIVALTGGVVENIDISEGDTVSQGQELFTLSSNYSGGNMSALSAQIADASYKNTNDTFDEQKSIIQKQRDLADATHDNFSDMQKIATQSANDTNNLINANQTILDQLNQQLLLDQQNNAPQATILSEETQINQLQGGQNQLKAALSNLQEQTDSSKPPGRLADTAHDLTMQQLDIQEKSLELNLEISKLQAEIADVAASAMFPVSPFGGVVERVYVKVGQFVNPGTPLAEIVATKSNASAVVDVPENIAKNVSALQPSTITINDKDYDIRPLFVPTEPTNGSLFTIVYPISKDLTDSVSSGEYVSIAIPIGMVNTSSVIPFVPLDSVYQTQDSGYVLVDENGKAVAKQITTGAVFGDYVQVKSGLQAGDMVILNRNIIAGDTVKTN